MFVLDYFKLQDGSILRDSSARRAYDQADSKGLLNLMGKKVRIVSAGLYNSDGGGGETREWDYQEFLRLKACDKVVKEKRSLLSAMTIRLRFKASERSGRSKDF